MDRLWSPWRGAYVSGDVHADAPCFLCSAADGEGGAEVVDTDASTITLLNRFPYNTGHVLVAPRTHVGDIVEAGDDLAAALMVAARRAVRAVTIALHPDGFNIGINHGGAAGASVEHAHLHVVPRWSGDTNFMPVVGGVKVLPELLADTAARLRTGYADLG